MCTCILVGKNNGFAATFICVFVRKTVRTCCGVRRFLFVRGRRIAMYAIGTRRHGYEFRSSRIKATKTKSTWMYRSAQKRITSLNANYIPAVRVTCFGDVLGRHLFVIYNVQIFKEPEKKSKMHFYRKTSEMRRETFAGLMIQICHLACYRHTRILELLCPNYIIIHIVQYTHNRAVASVGIRRR